MCLQLPPQFFLRAQEVLEYIQHHKANAAFEYQSTRSSNLAIVCETGPIL